jgi:hypothetical protein
MTNVAQSRPPCKYLLASFYHVALCSTDCRSSERSERPKWGREELLVSAALGWLSEARPIRLYAAQSGSPQARRISCRAASRRRIAACHPYPAGLMGLPIDTRIAPWRGNQPSPRSTERVPAGATATTFRSADFRGICQLRPFTGRNSTNRNRFSRAARSASSSPRECAVQARRSRRRNDGRRVCAPARRRCLRAPGTGCPFRFLRRRTGR